MQTFITFLFGSAFGAALALALIAGPGGWPPERHRRHHAQDRRLSDRSWLR